MTTLLLLRHGETALNASGALRGLVDVPLNEHGRLEARALATRVAANYGVDALFASPLDRARATAQEIATLTGLHVELDERFVDLDYGEWAGRDIATFAPSEREAYDAWLRDPSIPLPGAESARVAQARAMQGLSRLAGQGETVAIVTHDAILQLILSQLLGLELRTYRGLTQHTATLNEISHREGGFHVKLLNSAWHLSRPTGLAPLAADGEPAHVMRRIREISAGGVVLRDNDVLVLRLPTGEWILPKGHLEDGEDFASAAMREVREETGLEAAIDGALTPTTYAPTGDASHRKTVHWFRMGTDDGDESLRPGPGFAEARWVAIEDAGHLLRWPDQRAVVGEAARQRAGDEGVARG